MNWVSRFWSWLKNPPVVTATEFVNEAGKGEATEICEADWRTALEISRQHGYRLGLAEGELRGRLVLAAELEQQFSLDGGMQEFTAEEARRVKQRQVH